MPRGAAIAVACISIFVIGYSWSVLHVPTETLTMTVAYEEGDIFNGLHAGSWNRNEVKPCQRVMVPSTGDHILICGLDLEVAWQLLDGTGKEPKDKAAESESVRYAIYKHGKSFPVTLQPAEARSWNCRMVDEGISCK
jgi:hypothetical protein